MPGGVPARLGAKITPPTLFLELVDPDTQQVAHHRLLLSDRALTVGKDVRSIVDEIAAAAPDFTQTPALRAEVIALVTALQQHHAAQRSKPTGNTVGASALALSPASDARTAAAAAAARLHPPTHAIAPSSSAHSHPAPAHAHAAAAGAGTGGAARARAVHIPAGRAEAASGGGTGMSRGRSGSRSGDDDAASASFGDEEESHSHSHSHESHSRLQPRSQPGLGASVEGARPGSVEHSATAAARQFATMSSAGGTSFRSQAYGHGNSSSPPDSPSSLYDFGDTSGGASEGHSPAPVKTASRTSPAAAPASIHSTTAARSAPPTDARALVTGIGDLQRVGPAALQAAKARMDVLFESNRLKPGDPGYVYDRRVEFGAPQAVSDWDDE